MENAIDKISAIKVVFFAIVACIATEALNYFLVYNTDDYRTLSANIKNSVKKLTKAEEMPADTKIAKKQKTNIEAKIKDLNAQMSLMRMKTAALTGVLMVIFLSTLNNYFHSVVVAKLPFEPFKIIQGITHRGLQGTNYRDCAYIFLYILTGIVMKSNVQKIFGWEVGSPVPGIFDNKAKMY